MVKLYVEGGGDTNKLKTECREGFFKFLQKAGLKKLPRVVACGSRRDAFDAYCTALRNGETALLLLDSEAALSSDCAQGKPEHWKPWRHLQDSEGPAWAMPKGGTDADCHLMVQCMESWLLADRDTLKNYFGQGFKENQLPAAGRSVEEIDKKQVLQSLKNATRDCKTKKAYDKGTHSFALLGLVSADAVVSASPWAQRLVDEVKRRIES